MIKIRYFLQGIFLLQASILLAQETSGDCLGAIPICYNTAAPFVHVPGNVFPELNSGNAGCMIGETNNVWVSLHFGGDTPPCSPFAFDIVQAGGATVSFDFVIWGPYPEGSTASSVCPITQLPYRCNWASTSGPKGLAYNNSLPTQQFGGGGPMARHLVVNPGEVFFMMVNRWSGPSSFEFVWKTPAPTFQVQASHCTGATSPAPAGSIAVLGCEVQSPVVLVAKVMLSGPFNTSTSLMDDQLRQLGLIPLVEPYSNLGYPQINNSGGENTSSDVLAVSGNDAIVDWVRLELRDPVAPSEVIAVTHGLLQRDGDIVAADGSPEISFQAAPGEYHLVVRHRNHLGCMTASPINLGGTALTVDLGTFTTATFGNGARKDINGAAALWPGNVNGDDRIQYTGDGNDRDVILQAIGSTIPTAAVTGYLGSDVNLDGVVKYAGGDNDRDIILQSIGGSVPTAIKLEQLP